MKSCKRLLTDITLYTSVRSCSAAVGEKTFLSLFNKKVLVFLKVNARFLRIFLQFKESRCVIIIINIYAIFDPEKRDKNCTASNTLLDYCPPVELLKERKKKNQ